MITQNFYECRFDKYSQNGEDGILEALIDILKINKGFFVEFGAWDGKKMSNCAYLSQKGWRGCFIEGDPKRFLSLKNNYPCDSILKLNIYVSSDGQNSYDKIMNENLISNVDILSIDIDSDDLEIWQNISTVLPKILIIEYNYSIPFDTRYTNPKGAQHGNSALSIYEASKSKDYILVEGTKTNLIFLQRDIAEHAGIVEKGLQLIKNQIEIPRYFFGYDGTFLQEQPDIYSVVNKEFFRIPWVKYICIQPIPRMLRGFCDDYALKKYYRIIYSIIVGFLRSPIELLKFLYKKKSNANDQMP